MNNQFSLFLFVNVDCGLDVVQSQSKVSDEIVFQRTSSTWPSTWQQTNIVCITSGIALHWLQFSPLLPYLLPMCLFLRQLWPTDGNCRVSSYLEQLLFFTLQYSIVKDFRIGTTPNRFQTRKQACRYAEVPIRKSAHLYIMHIYSFIVFNHVLIISIMFCFIKSH